jgi:dTDP-4-amino-4,6-dideoxygalactose transaminase
MFVAELAAHFCLAENSVALAASGTAALMGAILGAAGAATASRPLCFLPSFTYSATGLAAERCGYALHFVDIAPDSWAIDPEELLSHPLLSKAGLVIAVAPFGRSVDQVGWHRFSESTGVPVVIDAAAAFESLSKEPQTSIGQIPVALSFHATKAFSTGEGGCVLCTEPAVVGAIKRSLNFGMAEGRVCKEPGFNGKMSEYHAAVGLAELAQWPAKHQQLLAVAKEYSAASQANGLERRLIAAPDVASCYVLFEARNAEEVAVVRTGLDQRGFAYRSWYGGGLHAEPHFSLRNRDPLPRTCDIAGRLLGLPTAPDLPTQVVSKIVTTVAEAAGATSVAVNGII